MGKSKIDKEVIEKLIEDYRRKKLNRKQICDKLRVPLKRINNWLYFRNIEIWDKILAKRPENKIVNKYVALYERKKITRKQIAAKLSLSVTHVNNWLYRRNIPIWDTIYKYTKISYPSGKEEMIRIKKPEEEWKFIPLTKKELKKMMTNFENYEKMIYEYNK